jgi:PKD repeat protein/uncharacterized protein YjdB
MSKFIRYLFILLSCFCSIVVRSQVTASFTASDTAGCATLIVHFINTSVGATGYSWDLGNSTTSLLTDASASYPSAGTYTVTLTAFGSGGTSSTFTKVIRVYAAPTVGFSASDTAICPGASVTFTNTSVPNAWGGLSNNWNFGDGGTSTASSPVYTYYTPGYFSVTLFAANGPGCSSSLSKASYIHVYNHSSVSFSATPVMSCKTPAAVTFTNGTTGTGPFTYKWLFGDGGTSSASNPTHNYTSPGVYSVVLKATNKYGCTDSLMQYSYITVGNIAASFTLPSSTCLRAPLSFTNTSSAHLSSQWYFGDGGSSTAENPVYTYTKAGTFTVKLIIFDGSCYDSLSRTITIAPLPTGSLSSSPIHPCPPSPSTNVTYTATVPGGTSVAWLFGDGTTGTGPTKVKSYSSAVIDFVDMILTNSAGCKDTIQRIDTIYNLYMNPSGSPLNGCVPLKVDFSMYSYSVVYNNIPPKGFVFLAYPYSVSGYNWNFKDGSAPATGPAPTHTFTTAGSYNVTCAIVTSNGCMDTGTVTVNVGTPPTASFTATPRHICGGRPISFKSTSTGVIDSFYWYFGDGYDTASPLVSSIVHYYSKPGIFPDSLIVKNFGCPSKAFYLKDTLDSPVAIINYTYNCIPGNQVTFRDFSFGDDTHLWQFGDGATSTAFNITHAYPSLSTFNVILTTYNARTGCRDSSYTQIDLAKPTMDFKATKLALCKGEVDTFKALISGSAYPPMGYYWYVDGVVKDSVSTFITSFAVTGLHTITLIIKNNHGCFDTLVKPNYVLVAKPTASFKYSPSSGCSPVPVTFTDMSTDVAGVTITKYAWSFGDGGSGTGSAVAHTYTSSGTFSAYEIVTDNLGCADTFATPPVIAVSKPIASYVASVTNACLGTTINFINTSSAYTTWLWSFGDGSTSTLVSPDHVYTAAGTYTVKLGVGDTHGCTDTLTQAGYITVNPSPKASFVMSDTFSVCPPLNVHFTNTSTGATSWSWSFGDGSFSTALSPSEPYLSPGAYSITLSVKNAFGCTDTAIKHASVFGYKGSFSYKPFAGCAPLSVNFKATTGVVASIQWDFSDGTISGSTLSDTITHKYLVAGTYLPKLILTDTAGCRNFSIGADTIKVDTLITDFSMAPDPGCQNTTIAFNDLSKSLFSTKVSWLWAFGTGATSTLSSPIYTYTASGTFPVTLSVTLASGCTGTVTKNAIINPTPGIIKGATTVCQGNTSALTDGTISGTWSSSNTTVADIGLTSGMVTGVLPGTATITFTGPGGCFTTTLLTIKSGPLPITGATGICKGLTTSLTDATAGGVWSSSNSAVATIGSASGVAASLSLGTTTITYKLSTGCLSATTVIVTTAPTGITGPALGCLGSPVALSDAIVGGAWSSSNTTVATVGPASGVVSGLKLGTTTITYSLGTGCTVTRIMTVVPAATGITGGSVACAASSVTLSDGATGGIWSSSNTAVATVSGTGVVTGVKGGTATIYYTLGSGCSAFKPVTVNPAPPITGVSFICTGTSTTLSDTISGGTWSSGSTAIVTIDPVTGYATGHAIGAAGIKYTLPNGCVVTTTLNVISAPAAISGPKGVCVGLTIVLSDATPMGTWSSGNTSIATIDSLTGLAGGVASGTVLISYSISPGCAIVSTIYVNPVSPVTGKTSVCAGETIMLGDTTLGGTWSSGNTLVATAGAGTGIVTGIAAGTATISYTLPSGCFATYIVTVLPLPAAITGPDSLCAGEIAVFSDATKGGLWSSSNMTTATIGGGSGLVIALSAGTTIITYAAAGCHITTTVTVNPLPGSISGNLSVCLGNTSNLSDALPGGVWSSSNTTTAPIGTSGVLTGLSAGTASISYVLSTGCLVVSTATVNPILPAIAGKMAVCAGMTTALSNAVAGGTWTSSNTTVARINIATGLVTGVSAGATVIYYTSGGCNTTATVTVNPLPGPISGGSDVCIGATTTVSDAGGGTWVSGNTAIATVGLTSGIVTGVSAGVDTIAFVLVTGCFTTTTVTVNPPPSPITGTLYLCTTLTTSLNNATVPGTWSSNNTSVATIDAASGIVSGVAGGTATISYAIGTGCTATATVTVYTYPKEIASSPKICIYSTANFTDSVPGGTWSSDNTAIATVGSSSGIASGISLGTTIFTYTVASSCSVAITVSVLPLPNIFTVSGGGRQCAGDTGKHVFLSGSLVGTNYFVYLGGVKATGPFNGTGLPMDLGRQTIGGVYTVVATSTATGCSNMMAGNATLTVDPVVVPAISISALTGDSVCSGVSTTFSETSGGGGSAPVYEWNVNGIITGTATRYTFIPANGDVVTCKMTSNATCASPATVSGSMTMKVILPQTPSATLVSDPGDTICGGLGVSFKPVTIYGGATPAYTWMVNGAAVGYGTTFAYTPANGDIVYCKIKSNYFCLVTSTGKSNSVVMTVDQPIIPHVSITGNPGASVALGQYDTLTAHVTDGGPAPTYQWFVNTMPVAGATTNTFISNNFSIDKEDSVSCTVTSSGFCVMSTHEWLYISVHNVGVNTINTYDEITVLPNPNNGTFTIRGTLSNTMGSGEVRVEITDLLGQTVYKGSIPTSNGGINERITLSDKLANSIYILNLRSGSDNKVYHIVVEK